MIGRGLYRFSALQYESLKLFLEMEANQMASLSLKHIYKKYAGGVSGICSG